MEPLRAKSIIIAGAGVAGLAAGCYTRMNGYQTPIYEMADIWLILKKER